MPLRLRIDVLGEQQVNRSLLRFERNVEDARPAFAQIMRLLEAAELEQFNTEGAAGGEKWADLKDSTLKRKPAGKGILENSGRLLNSLVEGGVAGRGDAVRFLDRQEMMYGTRVPYATFHQTGTSRMPRRRVVQLPEAVRRAAVRVLQRAIVTGT